MSSATPAENYAEARAERDYPETAAFARAQRFDLDPFQLEGCRALERGSSALVAAPTGAGKTIVGEFAIHLAMASARDKAFYTTPMKALSNQKFRELQEVYGAENVGLLTGDTNINSHARVVVMTTEVLRNMIYAGSGALDDLRYVVMDEVHYLADRFRGAVWEEVIIHLPQSVRLVGLSATVSNAEEFGDWIGTVRGGTEVIVSEIRPVPLEQHVLARGELVPLFDGRGTDVNRELLRMGPGLSSGGGGHHRGRGRGRQVVRPPRGGGGRLDRARAIELLDRQHLLPAIFFIFSRVGCDQAVVQTRHAGIRVTTPEERSEIRRIVHERTAALQDEDLGVLGFYELVEGPRARHRGAPRGPPSGVQGGRRGALPEEAREGRLRDRDARARHQHAGSHGRAREAREVQRRDEGADHVGGVHAADGPRGPPRNRRRRGTRSVHWSDGMNPKGGRVARLAPHVPAELVVPADLQHGREPHRSVRPARRARHPRVVVRAVPGRPRGGRHRTGGEEGPRNRSTGNSRR